MHQYNIFNFNELYYSFHYENDSCLKHVVHFESLHDIVGMVVDVDSWNIYKGCLKKVSLSEKDTLLTGKLLFHMY